MEKHFVLGGKKGLVEKIEFEAKCMKKLAEQTTLQENQITLLKLQLNKNIEGTKRESGLHGWGIETHF